MYGGVKILPYPQTYNKHIILFSFIPLGTPERVFIDLCVPGILIYSVLKISPCKVTIIEIPAHDKLWKSGLTHAFGASSLKVE